MTEIILDGVDENHRKKAKNEIKQMLHNSIEACNLIDLVRITNNFEEVVRKLTADQTYTATHVYGTAGAKTIPMVKNGKLRYALVFDEKFFGGWETSNEISRFASFIHEISHVDTGYRRWLEVGEADFFSIPQGKQGWLLHTAIIIWEEYEADRLKFQVLGEVADKFGGKITDGHTLGLAEDLENLLGDLTIHINQWKTDYKKCRLSGGELCYKVSERLSSILILWAHVVPGVYVIDDIKKKMTAIENLEGYKQFFSNNLKNIRSTLEYLYSQKRYFPEKIKYISNQIEEILVICGFEAYDFHGECGMRVIEKEKL